MKNLKLSLIAALAIGVTTTSGATTLSEALTNGKVSGEFTATYENRNFKKDTSSYYRDSAYSVGSFALKYQTGVWNNLSLTSKFRAYGTIFEDNDDSNTGTGTGDATGRFHEKDGSSQTADIEELFLAYKLDNVSLIAGRQFIATDWMNKTQDAVRLNAKYNDTSIEAIWSLRQGRVYSREYFPMTKINDGKGVYKLGLTQKLNDNLSATAYGLVMPDKENIYGAKANIQLDKTSIRLQYAKSDDKDLSDDTDIDSNVIDLKIATNIAGFSPFIGFIKVDDDALFPGYMGSGETIVPFEEGDYVYNKDAQTIYLGLSKSFGDLSGTLLYGTTKYDPDDDEESQRVHETTLWLGYQVMKDLKANLGYTLVDEDSQSDVSDYDQLNLTLTYSY